MTSKLTRLTDDELTETLRQATSGYPLPVSVEGNLRHAFAELQERRKAAMDSEPDCKERKLFCSTDTARMRKAISVSAGTGDAPLYLHAQPAPVVPDGLLSMAASAIEDLLEHTDPNTSYYSGVWADVPGKLRAAMLAAAPQEVRGE